MRIITKRWVFSTKWSDSRRMPGVIRHVLPEPSFVVGVSFFGCAVVKRDWWNSHTDFGKNAAD